MKNQIIIVFLCFVALPIMAQQKAVTENGEEVILYDNHTWELLNAEDIEAIEIPINPKKFTKGEKSTFLLKSQKINLGVWLEPKKWTFSKATENPEAEYEFKLKEGDLYGMFIAEKFEIPLETLRGIAVENGKSVAPDLKIVHEEYRKVNGNNVLLIQMEGTMQGIKFAYYGYYYSNASGTLQFITYTGQSLMKEYKKASEELLNGLVEIEE